MVRDVVIEHPNRMTASARAARAAVIALLLASALLLLAVSIVAWDALAGAKALQLTFILLYAGLATMVLRWRRGVLPVAAALGAVLLIFAAISTPDWFARDQDGFGTTALAPDLVALLVVLLVPLQLLLITVALYGFQQAWNVEVERPAPPRGSPATGRDHSDVQHD